MRCLALVLVLLTGCQIYFSDDDDDTCPPVAYLDPVGYRDPQNGTCRSFGPYPCDSRCGYDCPATGAEAQPDWAVCHGECEAILFTKDTRENQERRCIATPGCRAIYANDLLSDAGPQFADCWGIAQTGPDPGSCDGLDAQSCSRHDNCAAVYNTKGEQLQPPFDEFARCVAEVRPPDMACADLATETACSARTDCVPIYRGENCTCTPSQCTCEVLTYQRCETR